MKALVISVVASAGLCVVSTPILAMPVANLAPAVSEVALHQNVLWVCGPYRCWWRPWGYYRPWAYYRPWYGPYGYYRPYGFYGYGPQGGGYGGQGNTTTGPLSTGK